MSGQAPAHPPIGVLIVEDHPATRQGLRTAIECQPDLCMAGEADSWPAALALVQQLSPDVVVLDLNLSGRGNCHKFRPFRR